MYRTITYRAILVDAEINGKVYSCLHKILHNLDPADDVKSLEREIAATGNTSLYLGTSEWEEWYQEPRLRASAYENFYIKMRATAIQLFFRTCYVRKFFLTFLEKSFKMQVHQRDN